MRKSALTIVAVGVAAAMSVAGCSSSSKSKTASTTSAAAVATTTAGATTTSAAAAASGTIGVILPDTVSSTRYELYDRPLLTAAITGAGFKADVQNAKGSDAAFATIGASMIAEGVKVLLIDPPDPSDGVALEAKAKKAGIPVIDYDRLNAGGSADYYVSYDNQNVGVQQAKGLLTCLKAENAPKGAQIIQLNGGTDIDNNAKLFKAGANSVLQPAQAAGTIKIVSSTDVSKWDNTTAGKDFQQALTANGGKVAGVLAANDGIGGAAITILKTQKLTVPVTGQDATVQGLQYILEGQQCMTVFKDVKKEANAAGKLAVDLAKGDSAAAKALATGSTVDPTTKRAVPSYLLTAESVFKANVKDVITAGALTAAQICAGITAVCAKAGIK